MKKLIIDLMELIGSVGDPKIKRHLEAAFREATRQFAPNYSQLTDEEIDLGKYHSKIACVKAHRARSQFGLKESKDAVEEFFQKNGFEFLGL